MKFSYERYTIESQANDRDEVLHRPMLPVRVTGTAGDVFIWALLDSGAD